MATITQAQTVGIVELYIAFFGRAPEHSGLEFWKAELSASLDAGVAADTAMNTIADRFYDAALQYSEQTGYRADASIADFVDETYSNVLLRTGDMAPNATEMAYWVEKAGAEGLSRGELVREMISEAKAYAGDPEFGYIVARLNNRTEVGLEFAEEENSGNLSGVEAISAGQAALAGVDETDASVDAAISAFAGPPSGTVIDGKVAGATVGIDVNGDGEISDDEPTVTTDAQGNYEFPDGTPRGTVIASGGTDISTGLAFEGELTAPSGSDVVSPLTTLIDRIAKSDTDPNKTQAEKVADAQTQLKALLGLEDIDADLTEFDVVTETSENDPSGSDGLSDGNALRLYAASVKLMNVIEQGAAAIEGAGNVDGKTAFKAMVDALSGELRSGSGPVDLNAGDSQTIINAINGAASQTLDAEGQAKVAGIAGSAAKIAAAGNTEVDNAVNALGAGDPVNPNDPDSGSTINDALVSIVKSQKAVQGDGADQIRQGAQNGEDGADAADDFSDGNGGINDDVQDNQNVGDVNGDGQDDDGQDGAENDGGDAGGSPGGSTPPPPAVASVADGTLTIQAGSNVTIGYYGGDFTVTAAGASSRTFDAASVDQIDLNGFAVDMSATSVNALFPNSDAGQLDLVGFDSGGTFNITGADFGNIAEGDLKGPAVWVSDEDTTDPTIAGFKFSEVDEKSVLPEGFMVNGDAGDGFKAFWDAFDDYYGDGNANYYNDMINLRFVYLANDYAAYLQNGGEAVLDIVKTSGDYTNRQQTLHDNILGNLRDLSIQDRFSGDAEPRSELAKEFGDRPEVSGGDGTLEAFELAKAWDLSPDDAFTIARDDANVTLRIGQLSPAAVDGEEVWNGDGNSPDNYRIVELAEQEIELGIKVKERGQGDYGDDERTDLHDLSFYDVPAEGGTSSDWNVPGGEDTSGAAENMADWSFDISISTDISDNDGSPRLADYGFKLIFDVDPSKSVSLVTYEMDRDDPSNWLFEGAQDEGVRSALEALMAHNGDSDVIIGDNTGENGSDSDNAFVAQNSQNYGFVNSFERFVNAYLDNAYNEDGSKVSETDYWEAESDHGDFVIGLEAYSLDSEGEEVELIGQNYVHVDSVGEVS